MNRGDVIDMNIKRHNVISAQFLIVLSCFIEQVSPKIVPTVPFLNCYRPKMHFRLTRFANRESE